MPEDNKITGITIRNNGSRQIHRTSSILTIDSFVCHNIYDENYHGLVVIDFKKELEWMKHIKMINIPYEVSIFPYERKADLPEFDLRIIRLFYGWIRQNEPSKITDMDDLNPELTRIVNKIIQGILDKWDIISACHQEKSERISKYRARMDPVFYDIYSDKNARQKFYFNLSKRGINGDISDEHYIELKPLIIIPEDLLPTKPKKMSEDLYVKKGRNREYARRLSRE